jgi:predicted cobalt transporter CbtA
MGAGARFLIGVALLIVLYTIINLIVSQGIFNSVLIGFSGFVAVMVVSLLGVKSKNSNDKNDGEV